MARNASGTYSLPSGNPVVSGATIDSSDFNDTMTDLGTEITDSLSRSGKGGMSAALELADGSEAAPGLAFTGDTDTGLYRIGANDLGFVTSGTGRLRLDSDADNPLEIYNATGTQWHRVARYAWDIHTGATETIDETHMGKAIQFSNTQTITLDNDSDIPDGGFFIVKATGGTVTIAEGTGVTIQKYLEGTTGTGDVTLTAGDWCIVHKRSDTVYDVFGGGIA